MRSGKKIIGFVNAIIVASILVLNYFYQSNGFDFTLKCVCSGGFALLGVINLVYALLAGCDGRRFYVCMTAGLVLAMLGDVLIGYDFIVGAATFALGHISFVVAYCFLMRVSRLDLLVSGALAVASSAFLLFFPLLTFDAPIFRAVCIVYAVIISFMLGKAIGNVLRTVNAVTAIISAASVLFFFSDLMLVLDWFVGRWSWTDHACMGTYYPALCLLALSMPARMLTERKKT